MIVMAKSSPENVPWYINVLIIAFSAALMDGLVTTIYLVIPHQLHFSIKALQLQDYSTMQHKREDSVHNHLVHSHDIC